MLSLSNFCKLKFNCFTFSNSSEDIAILCTLLSKAIRRKIKEFRSKAETALWFAESYGLLESTDGQTVKVDFNPSSSKSSCQDLPEEERQKIKDLLFILEKFNVSESAYRELTVFCDGFDLLMIMSNHR
jgi:SpoVK/Ycf46/Vps4 family AAA+-type ATPase